MVPSILPQEQLHWEGIESALLDQSDCFAGVLGAAAISLWGDLPQPIQEQLFERAVLLGHRDERDEMLRECLGESPA